MFRRSCLISLFSILLADSKVKWNCFSTCGSAKFCGKVLSAEAPCPLCSRVRTDKRTFSLYFCPKFKKFIEETPNKICVYGELSSVSTRTKFWLSSLQLFLIHPHPGFALEYTAYVSILLSVVRSIDISLLLTSTNWRTALKKSQSIELHSISFFPKIGKGKKLLAWIFHLSGVGCFNFLLLPKQCCAKTMEGKLLITENFRPPHPVFTWGTLTSAIIT